MLKGATQLHCFFLCYIEFMTSLSLVVSRSFVEGVTMYSWLVTVLFLASAAYSSGGQGAVGWVGVVLGNMCNE